MKEIDLPDGTIAKFYEPKELTRGERRTLDDQHLSAMGRSARYLTLMSNTGSDPSTWDELDKVTSDEKNAADAWVCDSVLTRLVSWTRHEEVPKSPAEWDAFRPVEVYDTLAAAVLADMNEHSEEHGVDGALDPKVPSDASTNSTPTAGVSN